MYAPIWYPVYMPGNMKKVCSIGNYSEFGTNRQEGGKAAVAGTKSFT